MKIERIRKSHKKEIIIGTILTVVIGGALTFRLTHSKYRYTESIDLATGKIKYKAPDFQVMAMYQQKEGQTCTEDNCYDELTGRMPSSEYVINETKSYCNLNSEKDNNVIIKNVNGEPLLSNLIKGDKCYLYFDKQVYVADTILANVTVNENTPSFGTIATANEGVFKAEDPMYGSTSTNKKYSFYYRGAVENNHVIFAKKCWRIVRINGDKTIRLIYNGSIIKDGDKNICYGNGANENSIAITNQPYAVDSSTSNKSYYVGWTWDTTTSGGIQRPAKTSGKETLTTEGTYSNARTQIEEWYNSTNPIKGNLRTYEDKIADGKFCNDRNVDVPPTSWGWETIYTTIWNTNTGNYNRFAHAETKRLYERYNPTFECPSEDTYTLKVGLITADEVEFTGGKNGNNQSYYLYNGQDYWTMSPHSWNGTSAVMFTVYGSGYIGNNIVTGTYGLRPVINLNSDVTFSSGNGLKDSPYVVS